METMTRESPGGGGGARPAKPYDPLEENLFRGSLVVSNPPFTNRPHMLRTSLVTHGLAIALLILVPVFWPEDPPDIGNPIISLIYDPPPPPPPPLPRGQGVERAEQPKQTKPNDEKRPEDDPKFTAEIEIPEEMELTSEDLPSDWDVSGVLDGSEFGVEGGMDIGVEGGVLGGVPGGVIGGVVGGTGTGPVMDYDRPPRPIKMTQPIYPQEAFVKKIEGTVVVEIWIDIHGNVVRTRILQSIPQLDAAAIATVKQWRFEPALKAGRPVMTAARAPVTFRIY
jgi:protein TonB